MIWILQATGASTKLRDSPFTETVIEGVERVVYKPGIVPVPGDGGDASSVLGTYTRGLHRVVGFLFSYDGSVAETLFGVTAGVDLIVRYRANGQTRKRTFSDVLFVGDTAVTFPGLNTGVAGLIGVPFRVQIPDTDTLADHITDSVDS